MTRRTRRRLVIGVLPAIAIVTAAALFFLRGDGAVDGSDGLEDLEGSGAPPQVLYIEGSELKSITPGEEPEVLHDAIPLRAEGSADGSQVAYVVASEEMPTLHLLEVGTDEVIDGPEGTLPKWNHDGSKLAYLTPVLGESECGVDACEGPVQVGVYDTATGESEVWLDGAEWGLVGWAGDVLYTYDEALATSTFRVEGPDQSVEFKTVGGSLISSLSSDGRWAVANTSRGVEVFEFVEGNATYAGTPVEAGETMPAVSWHPEEALAAAVVASGGDTRLALFRPEDLELDDLEDSDGAAGRVHWGTGGGLVYTQLNRDAGELEAFYCTPGEAECEAFLNWEQGLKILAVT